MLTLFPIAISLLFTQSLSHTPRFEDFPVTDVFQGSPAPPILATVEQRRYRTRIRDGVNKGEGVWYGSWAKPTNTRLPNFAGHYYLIRWGCGSNCLMAAIVDAKTGRVYNPPLSDPTSGFYVKLDMLGDKEIDIHPQSRLLVLRNACRSGRSECGVFYFRWDSDKFHLLRWVPMDLIQAQPD